MYGLDSCRQMMYMHAPATCEILRPRVKFLCTASLYSRCAASTTSSLGRIPNRSANCLISALPRYSVRSRESTCAPYSLPPPRRSYHPVRHAALRHEVSVRHRRPLRVLHERRVRAERRALVQNLPAVRAAREPVRLARLRRHAPRARLAPPVHHRPPRPRPRPRPPSSRRARRARRVALFADRAPSFARAPIIIVGRARQSSVARKKPSFGDDEKLDRRRVDDARSRSASRRARRRDASARRERGRARRAASAASGGRASRRARTRTDGRARGRARRRTRARGG